MTTWMYPIKFRISVLRTYMILTLIDINVERRTIDF